MVKIFQKVLDRFRQVCYRIDEVPTKVPAERGEHLGTLSKSCFGYSKALVSVSGQYELWDQAAKVVEVSTESINTALESQVSYWQDYNANLQALGERTGEIEGLSDVIASFADGSAESVNAIAGMANASDEDLKDMVANWQELKKEQSSVSESIAKLKVDFDAAMGEMQTALVEDIEAMDLGDEAAASGRATIQGYINGANAMLPVVRSAYAELGRAAADALAPTGRTTSIWDNNRSLNMYASGTQDAAPGLALVGEEGPELVYFNGGEKVLNASKTAALQTKAAPAVSAALASQTGSSMVPVSVTFQIGGNATPEVVQDLHEFADEIVDRVIDVLEDAGVDAQRRSY